MTKNLHEFKLLHYSKNSTFQFLNSLCNHLTGISLKTTNAFCISPASTNQQLSGATINATKSAAASQTNNNLKYTPNWTLRRRLIIDGLFKVVCGRTTDEQEQIECKFPSPSGNRINFLHLAKHCVKQQRDRAKKCKIAVNFVFLHTRNIIGLCM